MGTRNNNAFVGTEEGLLGRRRREQQQQVDVRLGLRMQQVQVGESCPDKTFIMPISHSHHHSSHHQFSSLSSSSSSPSSSCCCNDGFDGGASGGGGPIVCNTSNQVPIPCTGDIYDVVGASSASVSAAAAAAAAVVLKSLNQPHPLTADPSFLHNSSGKMAAPVNTRVPFTAAQWQELERQTMIYKYMMASMPVPPELLLPLTRNTSNEIKGPFELGFSSNSSDPEPWRCRRTDGKKWRCSRDVARAQKYCERHSHKSRPRSRKPVELPNHSSIINNKSKSHTALNLTSDSTKQPPHHQNPHFINHTEAQLFTSSFDQPRCLEWFMKGETAVPFGCNSNPEWQQLKTLGSNKYGGNAGEYQQHFRDHLLNLHSQQLMISPSLASLGGTLNSNQGYSQETRSFIDAWSTAEREVDGMGSKLPHSSNEKLPLSSLTLSMSGGTNGENQEEDNENSQMGAFGFMGLATENVRALRPQMANPGSWMGSPPGGPLAEVLCLGIANSQSTSTSSCSKST